jgi:DNA polymerase III subunit delta'
VPIVPLFGHQHIKEQLSRALERGTLPASLLFAGPRGVGKQRLAIWLGQYLLCTSTQSRPCGQCQSCRYTNELANPDLHWVFPRPRLKDSESGAEEVRADLADAISARVKGHGLYSPPSGQEAIYVATVRAIVHAAALAPALGRRKVIVVGDADRMVAQEGSDQAANAFLKLLEEPPADTTIILTSSEAGALLPTIRSRVVSVRVPTVAEQDVQAFLADPLVISRLREEGIEGDVASLSREAAGAPGTLLAGHAWAQARADAKRLLDAATAPDRGARYRAAFAQKVSGARGTFSDTLDALTHLLRDRAASALARNDEAAAFGAAKAIDAVERAKVLAYGNVNPQLVSAELLSQLSGALQ